MLRLISEDTKQSYRIMPSVGRTSGELHHTPVQYESVADHRWTGAGLEWDRKPRRLRSEPRMLSRYLCEIASPVCTQTKRPGVTPDTHNLLHKLSVSISSISVSLPRSISKTIQNQRPAERLQTTETQTVQDLHQDWPWCTMVCMLIH